MFKLKGSHVILASVMIVLGFLISFSYQFTNKQEEPNITGNQWEKEYALKEKLFQEEQYTDQLRKELQESQEKISEIENELASQEKVFFNLVEDVEKLRLFAGTGKVKGPGIEISLSDASYVKSEENANNYIVHESHIHKVVHELRASGAKAVGINGQRLLHNSYIACTGPVINVDGNEFNAPFVITAIGDPNELEVSLNLPQGVKDQLVNDNVQVRIEKKQEIILKPYLGTSDDKAL